MAIDKAWEPRCSVNTVNNDIYSARLVEKVKIGESKSIASTKADQALAILRPFASGAL